LSDKWKPRSDEEESRSEEEESRSDEEESSSDEWKPSWDDEESQVPHRDGPTMRPMTPSPAGAEDRSLIVLAANSQVVAFRRSDGGVVWRHTVEYSVLGMSVKHMAPMELAFHGGRVYVAESDRVICLDYASGHVVGQVQLPGGARRPCFLLEGDNLYVVSSDRLLCLTHGGDIVWQSAHGLTLLECSPAVGVPGNVRQGDDIGT